MLFQKVMSAKWNDTKTYDTGKINGTLSYRDKDSKEKMYTDLLKAEIIVNHYVQQNFRFAEPLWIFLSEHFTAARIMDVFVPFVGVFHHQLLVRLVCSLGVMNALNSLMKWCSPEYRPYWWVRELGKSKNISNFILRQYPLTCETTAGFPSSHAMCFTTFTYLLSFFVLVSCRRNFQRITNYVDKICFVIVAIASMCMWLSRIYLASQFLHQCISGSIIALVLLHFFDEHADFLYTLSRAKAVVAVVLTAYLPVLIYFAMLHADIDPHWSVRMAFKWCKDPSQLRHEASPIFLLGRDFGFLLGVALSAPLYKRNECRNSLRRRITIIFAIEALNYYARLETPKDQGRLVFVGYECIRNLMHSYSLLTIVSKIP